MARFIYYNQNPDGQKKSDCVTRAISLATGLPYSTIRQKLHYTSKLYECPKLDVYCYCHLLDDVFKFQRVDCKGMSVGEFADKHNKGVFLVRMPQHISTIVDGNSIDIFDCRDYIITHSWRII